MADPDLLIQIADLHQFILDCLTSSIGEDQFTEVNDAEALYLESKQYEFRVAGIHSDSQQIASFASSIQALYVAQYPGMLICDNVVMSISIKSSRNLTLHYVVVFL